VLRREGDDLLPIVLEHRIAQHDERLGADRDRRFKAGGDPFRAGDLDGT